MDASDEVIDDRPLYNKRRTTIIRVMVLIAVGAMLLPILANFYSVGDATAQNACAAAVRYEMPDATGAVAKFEFFGAGVIGWECYAKGGFAGTKHILSLGLIPGGVTIPDGVRT